VAISICSRNRGPGPPGAVEVLGFKTRDIGIGSRGGNHWQKAGRGADTESVHDCHVGKSLMGIPRLPEIRNVGLFGGTKSTIRTAEITSLDEVINICIRCQRIGTIRPETGWVVKRERLDLTNIAARGL